MSAHRHSRTTQPEHHHLQHTATGPNLTPGGAGTPAPAASDPSGSGRRPVKTPRPSRGRTLRTALVAAAVATVLAPFGAAAAAGPASAADGTFVNGFANGVTAPKDGEVLTILQSRTPYYTYEGQFYPAPMTAVDVPHGTTAWDADLRVQSPTGATAQQFKFVKRGEWYQLRPLSGHDGLCLEATGDVPFEGQVVQQYGCDPNYQDQPNQLWQVQPASEGIMLRSKMGNWYMTASTRGHADGEMVDNLPLVMTASPGKNARFSLHAPQVTVEKWVNNMIIGGASINTVNCPQPYYLKEDSENSIRIDPTYNRLGDSGVRIYTENEYISAARFGFNNLGIPPKKRSAGVRLYCNLIGYEPYRILV